ncbi:MAG: NosD domain-containing protein [Promethearchaeota archaeon]
MKLNRKINMLILIILGIFFVLSLLVPINLSLITGNSNKSLNYNDNFTLDNKNMEISAVSGKIHIDNNWTKVEAAGICTGNGTYSDPYVIEDLVIDGGGSGSCILIENSDVYFRIENCSAYNNNAGIELYNTSNGLIKDNICSSGENGIYLKYSDYNNITGNNVSHYQFGVRLYCSDFTNVIGNNVYNNYWGIIADGLFPYTSNNSISGNIVYNNGIGICIDHSYYSDVSENIANYNTNYGIFIFRSVYNKVIGNTINHNDCGIFSVSSRYTNISGNIARNNHLLGIYMHESSSNMVSGNIMNKCGLRITGIYKNHFSHNIDVLNLVNGKPLYYYIYKVKLNPSNFSNAGQVILVNCNDSLISNLIISQTCEGLSLYYCNNNTISGNIAYNNTLNGIGLYYSNFNVLSGNIINQNDDFGIYLYDSDYNIVSGNVLIGNDKCIAEILCHGNLFSNNGECTYGIGKAEPVIPGYNLIFLLGILSITAYLIRKNLMKP